MRLLALILASLSFGGTALAQDSARNLPTGGRSVLMGNTGIALGRDGSAPFLNPATIVAIDDTQLAFSVNLYRLALTNFSNFYQPRAPDAPFAGLRLDTQSTLDTSFDVLPTTLCLFFTVGKGGDLSEDKGRAGRQKIALCFGQTVVDDFILTASSVAGSTPTLTTVESISATERLRKASFGPTYGVHLTDKLALGASLHGTLTNRRTQWRATSLSADPQSKAITTSLVDDAVGTSFDITSILGATYRASPVTLGLAVSMPAVHVYGVSRLSTASQVVGTGTADSTQTYNASGSFSSTPPMRIDLGAGLSFTRTTLELDVGVQLPWPQVYDTTLHGMQSSVSNGQAIIKPLDQDFVAPARAAITVAAGFDHRFSRALGVLGGASGDVSVAPNDTLTATPFHDYPARQNRFTASLGVGSYGGATELLVGTELSYGFGKRYAPDIYSTSPSFSVIDTQTYAVMLVISGATNFQTFQHAVDTVRGVVPPDPKRDDPPK